MASFDQENREIKVEPEYFDVAGQSQSTPILNLLVDSENFAFQMDSNENDSYFKNCDGKDLLLFHENTSNQTQFHENIVKLENWVGFRRFRFPVRITESIFLNDFLYL